MLVALGFAAVTGAVGIMTAAGSGLWRLAGTSFLTAIAVALILPASHAMDAPAKRDGGLAAIVWVVVEFIIALLLIWSVDLLPERFAGHMAQLFFYWLLCGIPAVALFFSIHLKQFRIAALTGIALAGLIFVVLCVGTLLIDAPERRVEKVIVTALAMGGFGATIVMNLVHAGQSDRRYFRWAGVGAGVVGLLIALASIWRAVEVDMDGVMRVAMALGSAAAITGLLTLLLQVPLAGAQAIVLWGTMAAATLCAVCFNLLLGEQRDQGETLGRLMGASGVAAACGVLAIAVLGRLNRRGEYQPADASAPLLEMIGHCPRCQAQQHFKVNGTTCAACGLRVDIRIEEPCCVKCGYLLHMLKSPNCPECGTPVAGAPPVTVE